jgi:hypothetical protein
MMRINRVEDKPDVLIPLIRRFFFWSWPRTIWQVLNGITLVWALIETRPGEPGPASTLLVLLLTALMLESILAGGALNTVFVELPARQKIGTAAYAAYLRATDGANGRLFYPIVGLLSNAATIGAFIDALIQPAPILVSTLLSVAMFSGIAAFLVTRQVIPAMSQLIAGNPDTSAEPLLDRLGNGARVRAPLFVLSFACLLAALILAE